jgi:HPt (histidine-containing phosphotransfer) domain-containing protein
MDEDSVEIDFSVLDELAEGDAAVLADLVAMFVRHTTKAIGKARSVLAAGQAVEVARIAHTAIGFTATIGVTGLVPALRELERAAREGRQEDMLRLLKDWERGFEQARTVLEFRIKT